MSKFLVLYSGKWYIVEADDFDGVFSEFWKYPEFVTAIIKMPEDEANK